MAAPAGMYLGREPCDLSEERNRGGFDLHLDQLLIHSLTCSLSTEILLCVWPTDRQTEAQRSAAPGPRSHSGQWSSLSARPVIPSLSNQTLGSALGHQGDHNQAHVLSPF